MENKDHLMNIFKDEPFEMVMIASVFVVEYLSKSPKFTIPFGK